MTSRSRGWWSLFSIPVSPALRGFERAHVWALRVAARLFYAGAGAAGLVAWSATDFDAVLWLGAGVAVAAGLFADWQARPGRTTSNGGHRR